MKVLVFLFLIILAPIIGGVYGVIHDQITYTISPEYYTKFKFHQFGLLEHDDQSLIEHPRILASEVGFLASWWMGVPVGIVLGLIGFIHPSPKKMFLITMQSFGATLIVTFIIGLCGLAYGRFHLSRTGVDWWLPENLVDKRSFISVGSMHNFSYIGGIFGLVVGIVYTCMRWMKPDKSQRSSSLSGSR